MTAAAREVLKAFDALAPDEQQQVVTEILHRSAAPDELSEAALTELAIELFRAYDAEEAGGALS